MFCKTCVCLSLHALCLCTGSLGSVSSLGRMSSPPAIPGSRVTVQWVGMEEKELAVLSAGHEHLKSSGASSEFWSHSQIKYFFHLLFCDCYFSFLFLSLRKQKSHSSAWQLFCSHCLWHSLFPSLLWLFSKVIRIRPESKSDWVHPPTGGGKAQCLKQRFHCLITATSDHSLCNKPLPAQQQEYEPQLYLGLREK